MNAESEEGEAEGGGAKGQHSTQLAIGDNSDRLGPCNPAR